MISKWVPRVETKVGKLSRRGLSGRKIAAELNIPAGSMFALLKKARNGSVR
jgi:hypothetical protein